LFQVAHQRRYSLGVVALAADELREAEHRLEEVVEVVRHPAGQPTDRFHLLRLEELRLECHLSSHVTEGKDEVDDGARAIAHG